MKIIATTTFLHGRMRFEKGTAYEVPDAFAGFFIGNGWAALFGGDAEPVDLELLNPHAPKAEREGDTLEVQDVHIATDAKVGG